MLTHAMFFNFGHIWKNLCLMTHCVCVGACVCVHTHAPPTPCGAVYMGYFLLRETTSFHVVNSPHKNNMPPEGLDVLYAIIFVGLAYEQWKDICV
jgi:hypothetical protein